MIDDQLARQKRLSDVLAKQLQRSLARNAQLLTALRRIASLDAKNVPKYAQRIALEAIADKVATGSGGDDGPADDAGDPEPAR